MMEFKKTVLSRQDGTVKTDFRFRTNARAKCAEAKCENAVNAPYVHAHGGFQPILCRTHFLALIEEEKAAS